MASKEVGSIVYKVSVDTKPFKRSLHKTFTFRLRVAFFLVELAEKIGRVQLNYSIEQEGIKK